MADRTWGFRTRALHAGGLHWAGFDNGVISSRRRRRRGLPAA